MNDLLHLYYQPWVFFILGACIGSFWNVVLYRYPRGRSVVSPGSACPSCQNEIKFYDNIPIVSWLLLRGRCRNCKAPFSSRYMLNEAFYGFTFAIPIALFPSNWHRGISLSFALGALFPLVYLLLRHRRCPWYLYAMFAVSVAFHLVEIFG